MIWLNVVERKARRKARAAANDAGRYFYGLKVVIEWMK